MRVFYCTLWDYGIITVQMQQHTPITLPSLTNLQISIQGITHKTFNQPSGIKDHKV